LEKQIPQKTGNNDIGINNQQDLITTLSRKRVLKIDFSSTKSRMGDLFVYWRQVKKQISTPI